MIQADGRDLVEQVAGGRVMTNKSAPEEFPLDEIDLLVGWRAGRDEYLFTKAVAMLREWLLDTEDNDRLRDVLKEILAEAGRPAGNRPLALVPERPEKGAKRKSVSPLGTAADKPVELARRPLKTPFVVPGANDLNAPRKEMMVAF